MTKQSNDVVHLVATPNGGSTIASADISSSMGKASGFGDSGREKPMLVQQMARQLLAGNGKDVKQAPAYMKRLIGRLIKGDYGKGKFLGRAALYVSVASGYDWSDPDAGDWYILAGNKHGKHLAIFQADDPDSSEQDGVLIETDSLLSAIAYILDVPELINRAEQLN